MMSHSKIKTKSKYVPSVCKVESKEKIIISSHRKPLNQLISFCKGHCDSLRCLALYKISKVSPAVHEQVTLHCLKLTHHLIIFKWLTMKNNLILITIISLYINIHVNLNNRYNFYFNHFQLNFTQINLTSKWK